MTSKVSLPAGQRFMDAPDGFDARKAAELLLAVGPSHLLEPVGTPLAGPLIALEEAVYAENPIQLASTAQRRSAVAERTQAAGKHRARLKDPRLTGPGSDHVRNPERVIPRPARHPGRVAMTDVPKNRTRQDVNRYHPDDTPAERRAKAWQNFGDDLARQADYLLPWVREHFGPVAGDLGEVGVGYGQKYTPGRQKRESLYDRMRKHNARRYWDWRRAATNHPLSTFLDLNLPNVLGFRGWPTVSGMAHAFRDRDLEGEGPSQRSRRTVSR